VNLPLACLTHWYQSLLYVVPVVGVGGWGWWNARRLTRERDGQDAAVNASSRAQAGVVSDRPAH
jgi:hypothetical protein